jgi:dihydroxycyclohexadiene carboxylate dehydrogenase
LVGEASLEAGSNALAIIADLETYPSATSAVDQALARFDRIDILIENVRGTIWAKRYAEYEEAQIEAEIRRSMFPHLVVLPRGVTGDVASGRGAIVNVSSVATRGINRVPYAAAKGGVNAVTTCLAFEYAQHGVRVCAIAPGGTEAPPRRVQRNTERLTPEENVWMQQVVNPTTCYSLMKRYGTTEEQAAAILFLASEEASYITGVTLPVAGGDLG